jgi:hypothetical protein
MLITAGAVFWFLCGLLAIYLAFAAARRHQEIFDPIHIWLAILGPITLVLACIIFADGNHEKNPVEFPG